VSSEEVSGRGEVTGGAPVEGGLPRHFVARNIRFVGALLAAPSSRAGQTLPLQG